MTSNLKKVYRFSKIYGPSRACNKVLGRLRLPFLKKLYFIPRKPYVSMIGCGQFAFSCISYYISRQKGRVLLQCYDIDKKNGENLANYYGAKPVDEVSALLANEQLKILYIASNHSTHTSYAIAAMKQGLKIIYTEKPISTNMDQLVALISNQIQHNVTLYAGYNRPYSSAIQRFKKQFNNQVDKSKPFTINCFISGHIIEADHWYRNPEEGTRICGNVGHWLDLVIHLFNWRDSYPTNINISISYSNKAEPDDNITINLVTDKGDLVSIMLTARSEPFEGINESINIQYNNIIAKIDDFRQITIWEGDQLIRKRFRPKDVGHKRAVMQPFKPTNENREWNEVILSSLLMLRITEMIKKIEKDAIFNIGKSLEQFNQKVQIHKNTHT